MLIHPDHPLKHAWDTLVIVLITVVGIEIPLRIALQYEVSRETRELLVFEGIATLIFALDVLLRLNTARLVRGRVDTDRRNIVRHYLRSWFAVDVLTAIPFHLLFGGFWFHLLRMARLLRYPLLSRYVHRWEASHLINPNILRLIFFSGGVMILSHWVACGYLYIGMGSPRDPEPYLTAIYWSVTTLTTVGYGDIVPAEGVHRIYTMVVMFCGVGMYAYIIGTIARLIAGIDYARVLFNNRMDRVDAFMQHHDLPRNLRRRIRNYYRYLWDSRLGVDENVLTLELPEGLRTDVALFMMRDMLRAVPIFEDADQELLRFLAMRLQHRVCAPGDVVIHRGSRAECMFFIGRGVLEVLGENGEVIATMRKDEHFGEMALLSGEARDATVRASDYADVYSLDKEVFQEAVDRFPDFASEVRRVAGARSQQQSESPADS